MLHDKPLHLRHRRAYEEWLDDKRVRRNMRKNKQGATYITFSPNAADKKEIQRLMTEGDFVGRSLHAMGDWLHLVATAKYSERDVSWKVSIRDGRVPFDKGIYLCGYHSNLYKAWAVALYALVEKYQGFPTLKDVQGPDMDW